MKVQIKHRYNGNVLFECDVPDEYSGMAMRHALEKATESKVSLACADLTCADLTNADLTCADLTNANLTDADLTNADLTCVNLARAKNAPLVIYGLRWVVQINGFGQMKIGCQKHDVSAWHDFDDDTISAMSIGALSFWKQHKTMLLNICENYKNEASE